MCEVASVKMVDEDGDVDADIGNIDFVQQMYEQSLGQLGADDRGTKQWNERLNKARATKRSKLFTTAQMNSADRKITKLGRATESPRKEADEAQKKMEEYTKVL